MTKEESMVRSIMTMDKTGRSDIRILVYAVERAGQLLFEENIPMEEISIIKDVYEAVGNQLGKKSRTASRQIERLSIMCWDCMDREQRRKYLGSTDGVMSPKEMVISLAYYCRYGKSYTEVVQDKMKEFFKRT